MTSGELPVPNVTVTQRLLGLAAVRGCHPALAGSSEVDASGQGRGALDVAERR